MALYYCPVAFSEMAIMSVDRQLLPGFGILHGENPKIGQLHLQRIIKPHGKNLMAARKARQRLGPVWSADEVGDNKDQRPSLHEPKRRLEKIAEVRRCCRGAFRSG